MMANPRKAPDPTKHLFDPWNSASTGHQTAQNILSGSTSWRQSRSYKLSHQLRDESGEGGRYHRADLVGAGSETFGKDGRKANGGWEKGVLGLRERGCQDIRDSFGAVKRRRSNAASEEAPETKRLRESELAGKQIAKTQEVQSAGLSPGKPLQSHKMQEALSSNLFGTITIYLNGSTAPLISDHRLKQLIAQHGGNVSVALGRKTVTHVILSESGGLAAGKLQKEIHKIRGRSIKFVTAAW